MLVRGEISQQMGVTLEGESCLVRAICEGGSCLFFP